MKTPARYCLIGLLLISLACREQASTGATKEPEQQEFAIAIHGGAGDIRPDQLPDSLEQAYKDKLEEAIKTGHQLLKNGGTAVEAVQATINVMEDSPLFNAGKGAVLNHQERPELDAAIMEGKTLNAGAIAGVSHIKNPINLAFKVMTRSKHVLLDGAGAENFALEQGLDTVSESYFITPRRRDQVKAIKKEEAQKSAVYYDPILKTKKMGTVGCVALDKEGNLAAGTSTGGLTNKRFGRIGDSPLIGAGTYANNESCAVSCTGEGEYYIRGVVAYDMAALMKYKGLSVTEATRKIIHHKQPELGGSGGIIAMDHYGNVSQDFNTSGMFRAKMDDQGNLEVALYKQDPD